MNRGLQQWWDLLRSFEVDQHDTLAELIGSWQNLESMLSVQAKGSSRMYFNHAMGCSEPAQNTVWNVAKQIQPVCSCCLAGAGAHVNGLMAVLVVLQGRAS